MRHVHSFKRHEYIHDYHPEFDSPDLPKELTTVETGYDDTTELEPAYYINICMTDCTDYNRFLMWLGRYMPFLKERS